MKRAHSILAIATFTILAISLANSAHAAAQPVFYVRTDRASYSPGDSGQLLVTIRNEGDQALTIKNMTINFPWMSYLNDHWEGNLTIVLTPQALAAGQSYNTQQSFTVPTDGRAYVFSSGTFRIGTDIGGGGGTYRSTSFSIRMNAPTYTPLELSTSLFSIVLIGIMAIATFLLFMVNQALRRTRPTAAHSTS